jgi:hypothetical protein
MSEKQDEKEIKVTDKRRVKGDGPIVSEATAPEIPKTETEPECKTNEEEYKAASESFTASENTKDRGPVPPVTFISLIFSLASSAMIYMGDVADPEGKSLKDVDMAKQTIDLLGILSEKTKGNLNPEEEKFLSSTLCDLRLRFVQVKK